MPRLLAILLLLLLLLGLAVGVLAYALDGEPAGEAGGPDAAVDDAPADSVPADSAPADSAPADSAPADSAPADDAPADDAPTASAPALTSGTQRPGEAEPPQEEPQAQGEAAVSMPDAAARAAAYDHLRAALPSRRKGWSLDYGWLQRLIESCPGGPEAVMAWLLQRETDEPDVAEVARRLLGFIRYRPRMHGTAWPGAVEIARGVAAGGHPLHAPERWLDAIRFVAGVHYSKATKVRELPRDPLLDAVEATGLAQARRAASEHGADPEPYLEELARIGARGPALHAALVVRFDRRAKTRDPSVLKGWTPNLYVAAAVVDRAHEVPEAVMRELEASKADAYRAIGLQVRAATTTSQADVDRIAKHIWQGGLDAMYREYTTVALLVHQAERLPTGHVWRMIRFASSSSYFKDHLDGDVSGTPMSIGNGLRAGTLVWDPERKLIRKPESKR